MSLEGIKISYLILIIVQFILILYLIKTIISIGDTFINSVVTKSIALSNGFKEETDIDKIIELDFKSDILILNQTFYKCSWDEAISKVNEFNLIDNETWRLPTVEEMKILHSNRENIPLILLDYYWSAEESDNCSAIGFCFMSQNKIALNKIMLLNMVLVKNKAKIG